ncbi:MAG TPA: pyroglutamyl-peptidase I [Planctomycetota bacterium]|nr:pyroglutamyl-peptidase I [Planctomycetota bacterium]
MILVTGFEPFGGLGRNPTGEIARALGGAVLPVDYARVGPALDALLSRGPRAVLLLGLAVGRPRISLERVAVNFRDGQRPDNTGQAPRGSELLPGGPAAYFSTLPLDAMHAALEGEGFPVEFSLSAGGYLCNAAFFLARHKLASKPVPCGFVHMPPTPDLALAAEPLPYERQLRAVERMLEVIGTAAA